MPQCKYDRDCDGKGEKCVDFRCVVKPGVECSKNSDCDSGKKCQNGKCVNSKPVIVKIGKINRVALDVKTYQTAFFVTKCTVRATSMKLTKSAALHEGIIY